MSSPSDMLLYYAAQSRLLLCCSTADGWRLQLNPGDWRAEYDWRAKRASFWRRTLTATRRCEKLFIIWIVYEIEQHIDAITINDLFHVHIAGRSFSSCGCCQSIARIFLADRTRSARERRTERNWNARQEEDTRHYLSWARRTVAVNETDWVLMDAIKLICGFSFFFSCVFIVVEMAEAELNNNKSEKELVWWTREV